MPSATFNGTVIAQSDDTVVVEGNHYFPIESVIDGVLEPSDHSTFCFWKGDASYYDVVVAGERSRNAAWYYAEPYDAASHIRDRVAFYPVVAVTV